MNNILTAHTEYANRPADERYPSLDALVAAAQADRQLSKEVNYNLRDLRAVALNPEGQPATRPADAKVLRLESPKGRAAFSHWSFGQAARMVGAPAKYLRTLPAALIADCLNHGMHDAAPNGTAATLLVRAPNGSPEPLIRAATSDSYGRLWDADLYGAVARTFQHDPAWQLPPTWDKNPDGTVKREGAYRGDRDSFLILTNGGSIVTDPTIGSGAGTGTDGNAMYRGIMVRNSEVGASSVTIETVMYRYICGNHILWGASIDQRFRRRHVGTKIVRDAVNQIHDAAYKFTREGAAKDEALIVSLAEREIAHTQAGVIDELRALGYTQEAAANAYAQCEAHEKVSPRSFWGIVQGTTRESQTTQYADERYELDQLAAAVLARGAKLVRV